MSRDADFPPFQVLMWSCCRRFLVSLFVVVVAVWAGGVSVLLGVVLPVPAIASTGRAIGGVRDASPLSHHVDEDRYSIKGASGEHCVYGSRRRTECLRSTMEKRKHVLVSWSYFIYFLLFIPRA